jgi:cbb3-type cytochrome oxidase subunit 3
MLLPSPTGEKMEGALAFFAIGCFVTVFIVGIIWATRPAHKGESRFR